MEEVGCSGRWVNTLEQRLHEVYKEGEFISVGKKMCRYGTFNLGLQKYYFEEIHVGSLAIKDHKLHR